MVSQRVLVLNDPVLINCFISPFEYCPFPRSVLIEVCEWDFSLAGPRCWASLPEVLSVLQSYCLFTNDVIYPTFK